MPATSGFENETVLSRTFDVVRGACPTGLRGECVERERVAENERQIEARVLATHMQRSAFLVAVDVSGEARHAGKLLPAVDRELLETAARAVLLRVGPRACPLRDDIVQPAARRQRDEGGAESLIERQAVRERNERREVERIGMQLAMVFALRVGRHAEQEIRGLERGAAGRQTQLGRRDFEACR